MMKPKSKAFSKNLSATESQHSQMMKEQKEDPKGELMSRLAKG